MKQTTLPASFLLIASTAGLLALGGTAADKVQAPTSKTQAGVVDFIKVFQCYPRAQAESQRLKAESAARQAELTQNEKIVDEMRVKRDLSLKDSLAYQLDDLNLQGAVQKLRALKQIYEADLSRRYEEMHVGWYEDAQRAIRQIAQEKGLQFVIRAHADLADVSSDSRAVLCERKIIWYAAAEIDITQAVIKLLPLLPKDPKVPAAKEANDAKPGDGKSDGKDSGKQKDEK